jgi:hypothetical protein
MSRLTLFLLLFSLTPVSFADRTFPESAKRGEWTSSQYPHVTISGKRYQLSPGAKVYDKDNRVILPTMYPSRATVAYQQDFAGNISKIWLLTTNEQRNFDRRKR